MSQGFGNVQVDDLRLPMLAGAESRDDIERLGGAVAKELSFRLSLGVERNTQSMEKWLYMVQYNLHCLHYMQTPTYSQDFHETAAKQHREEVEREIKKIRTAICVCRKACCQSEM